MPNTIRIKRSTATAVPTTLANAELAYSENSNKLFYGVGTGGAGGSATTILAIGGPGAYTTLDTTQTITGDKTLSGVISLTGTGASSATGVTQSVNDNSTRLATTAFVLGQANSTAGTIAMNGAQAAGTSNLYARADHVHPSDTTKANLASPTFTGTPAAPTAAVDTNTTQVATTAFVLGQASATTPAALGSAAVGTSTRYARADHVHANPTLSSVGTATADVSFGGFKITNLATPTADTDAATKAYVDAARSGLDVKQSVRVATTANITLSGTQTIDGVAVIAGDRVLVKDQSTASANGIYVVAAGAWSRSTDADTDAEVTAGLFTFVEEGTANADSGWILSSNQPITVGTTSLTFVQFSAAGQITAGAGLTKTGNTIDVASTGGGSLTIGADSINLTSGIIGTPGTYRSVTVDTYGRVTAGTTPTTFSGYAISDTSANLAAAITDETGSGSLVFATSPTLVTPTLGVASATTINKVTLTAPATGSTLTIADGKTLTASNTLTFTGTDSSSVAFGTGGTVAYTGGTLAQFAATTSAQLAGVINDETGSGALVFATSPSLTTPALSGETFSTTNNVSAGTNAQGQGALSSDYNVVTTAASNPSGVTLPTATVGRRIIIVNKGANPVNVYPATGGAIDALATNSSIQIPVNGLLEFNASSTTQWYSSFNASVAGTGVSTFSAGTTGLTPSTATTGAITLGGTLAAANGGTGVSNSFTITLGGAISTGGALTLSGAFATTLTVTAATTLTLPTSGTVLSDGSTIDCGTF